MAVVLNLTSQRGVQVTAAANPPDAQSVREALDVSAFDGLDLQLGVTAMSGTNPSLVVEIITSMDNTKDDGSWLLVGAFDAVSAAPTFKMLSKDRGFLEYIRWRVRSFTGTGNPVATFWIRGIGRRYGG